MTAPRRASIHQQLQLLVLAAVLPLAGLFAWFAVDVSRAAADEARSHVRADADRIAADLASRLREHEVLLARVASRPQVALLDSGCAATLVDYSGLHPELAGLSVRDRRGEAVCAVGALVARDAAGAQGWQAAIAGGGFAVSMPFAGPAGHWQIVAALPLRDDAGVAAGVVASAIDLAGLGEWVFDASLGETTVSAVDTAGRIVLRSRDADRWLGQPAPSAWRAAGDLRGDLPEAPGLDGVPRLFAYASVPGLGWRVVAGTPADEVHAAERALVERWALLGAIVIAGVLLLAWRIAGTIAGPIRALADASAKVAGGDAAARVEVDGPREVEEVGRRFNHMIEVRGHSEAALRESEARYRALTGLSSDWYWEQDEQLRFTLAGRFGEDDRYAWTTELVGHTRRDTPSVRYDPATLTELEALCAAHQPFREFRIWLTDHGGERRLVQISGDPVFAADGRFSGYRGIGRDVTARHQQQQQLELLEACLRRLNDIVMITEAEPLDEPGPRIVYVNDAFERRTGWRRDEVLGRSPRFLQGAKTSRAALGQLKAALRAQRATRVELCNYTRTGDELWLEIVVTPVLDADGRVTQWVAVERDIGHLRTSERALLESQERFQTIVESALDAVVEMDADGIIIGWNRQAEVTFGWKASQAIGRALHATIIPPRHHEAHLRGIRHYLDTGEGPVLNRRVELTALNREREEFPVELTVTPIRRKGEVVFSAFVRDLSERNRTETARLALEAQLRESQKMEAVGTLAGGIAHDFNNILGAMLGNIAMAREDLGGAHPAAAALELANRAGLRARSLVRQILSFSRRQTQHLVAQPLRPLVEETVALLRSTLPAMVRLEQALDDAPLYVHADATQMQQVLMNLCTNAWHALHGSTGRIEVGLRGVDLDAPALARLRTAARPGDLAPGHYAHLWVADSGSGMDEATRSRIFEPFFTTKPVGEGTGLGLAAVHGIVSTHGGAISVASELGRGSVFHVYLPATDAPEEATPTLPGALEPVRGRGEHVLYVDDDEVVAMMAERLLERAGYRVTVHRDARDAVRDVGARPREFDVVVTDFNMPDLSGLDLARDLAGIRADLPVLITSGLITDELRDSAARAGVRAVLHKENSIDELAQLVHGVLAGTHPAP